VDYIFSSHCLEHLPHWVDALDHWSSRLKSGGTLFLYLPHRSQEYWKPWNNRKHVHIFDEEMIRAYLTDTGYTKVCVSGVDLNNSFMAMAEKV
jgi:predicted SAM-dependent methyltransferase